MSQFRRELPQFCGSGLHLTMMGWRGLADPLMPGSRRAAATHFVLVYAGVQRIIDAEDARTNPQVQWSKASHNIHSSSCFSGATV
jgi:hypothetical protein